MFDLISFTLARGCHKAGSKELCVNEAAAMLAGENHTDMPRCVDWRIRNLSVVLNDLLGSYDCHETKAFLEALPWRLVGTRTEPGNSAYDTRTEIIARHTTAILKTDIARHARFSPSAKGDPLTTFCEVCHSFQLEVSKQFCRDYPSVFDAATQALHLPYMATHALPIRKALMALIDELIAVTEVKEVVPERQAAEPVATH